jgi:hypothetical protein
LIQLKVVYYQLKKINKCFWLVRYINKNWFESHNESPITKIKQRNYISRRFRNTFASIDTSHEQANDACVW